MSCNGQRKINWEPVKESIYQLYCVEMVTLDDLPKRMLKDFGFAASRRSYSTKIGDWGWKRNKRISRRKLRIRSTLSTDIAQRPVPPQLLHEDCVCQPPEVPRSETDEMIASGSQNTSMKIADTKRYEHDQMDLQSATQPLDLMINGISALQIQEVLTTPSQFSPEPVNYSPAVYPQEEISGSDTCSELGCAGLVCIRCYDYEKYIDNLPEDKESDLAWSISITDYEL